MIDLPRRFPVEIPLVISVRVLIILNPAHADESVLDDLGHSVMFEN